MTTEDEKKQEELIKAQQEFTKGYQEGQKLKHQERLQKKAADNTPSSNPGRTS